MNIYLKDTTNFDNNGLGFLIDVVTAYVTEEINGDYSLNLEYVMDGKLSEYLVNENIIKCKVYDGTNQLFVIKDKRKNFKTITIIAKHIFYQLSDNFLEDVYPNNLTCHAFLEWILNHTQYPNNFVAYSNINKVKSARYVRKNPTEAILGADDNSMVNIFEGELKRDNFKVNFLDRVGSDNNLNVVFGKNITGIDIEIDSTSVFTRIMPIGFDGLLLPEKYIDSINIKNYLYPKIKCFKFENIKYDPEDENAYQTLDDAYNALRTEVKLLFESGIDKPTVNVKIDWIELSKTKEYSNYSNLERVSLGDTIHAQILGETFETRVIKIKYNPLTDMIEEFEIGTVKQTIGNTITTVEKKVEEINFDSALSEAQQKASELIKNAMGGYVYKTQNELYIMDTNNPNTARNVWRWNINGLGYSSTGINGEYGLAITMDGKIVADFITAGILRATGSYFTGVHVNGGDIILNDDGTYDGASIKIETLSVYTEEIKNSSVLTGKKIYLDFSENSSWPVPSQLQKLASEYRTELITDSNNNKIYLRLFVNSEELYIYQLSILMNESTEYETLCTFFLNPKTKNSKLEFYPTKEFQLSNTWGTVKSISSLPIASNIKLSNSVNRTTSYSGTGIEAYIFSDFDFNSSDIKYVQDLITSKRTPTQEELLKYDVNKDGKINALDLLKISKYVSYNITKSTFGKVIINTHDIYKNLQILDGNGNEKLALGLDGLSINGQLIDFSPRFDYVQASLDKDRNINTTDVLPCVLTLNELYNGAMFDVHDNKIYILQNGRVRINGSVSFKVTMSSNGDYSVIGYIYKNGSATKSVARRALVANANVAYYNSLPLPSICLDVKSGDYFELMVYCNRAYTVNANLTYLNIEEISSEK